MFHQSGYTPTLRTAPDAVFCPKNAKINDIFGFLCSFGGGTSSLPIQLRASLAICHMSIPFFSTFLTAWQHLPPRCSLQGTLFIRTAVPLLSLLFLYPAPSAQAQSSAIKIKNKDYLLITADANDTPEELLERYNLDAFNCNEAHFYKINKIKKGGALKAGKEYQLPILIVDYNGSSIRTSLGIEDWRVAKRIETFNREADIFASIINA
jgi:hypothetical protein